MPDRPVRFTETFFHDLDYFLPSDRDEAGNPSTMDFLLHDLPRLRDVLSSDFEANTMPVPEHAPLRVLVTTGTLVASVAVYAVLSASDEVVVIALEIETWPKPAEPDGE
jgi:hypothetical protein